MLMRVN